MSEQVASLPEVVSRGSTNGLQPQPELQSMSHEDSQIIIMVRGGGTDQAAICSLH